MADLRGTRRKLAVIAVVLGIIDLACIGVLVSPVGTAQRRWSQQQRQLGNELQEKTREAVPLAGIDQKVAQAGSEIADFYKDRLPDRYSQILQQLGALAHETGIRFSGQYGAAPTDVPELQRVQVNATISGDYLQEVKFINALERSKMLFLIDSISLNGQESGNVGLGLTLETYLRTASPQLSTEQAGAVGTSETAAAR